MCGEVSLVLEKVFKQLVLMAVIILFAFPCSAEDSFLVLCYHNIPKEATFTEDVPQHVFVKQLEYLKTHGYEVISPDDIKAAGKGLHSLPSKSVLLTFDDAYRSFYEFVYPVLKLYGYPAILSVVTSWIDQKPDYVGKKELMSWEQIEEVASSELVSIASHTHAMHKGVRYNPAGNEEPATSTFIYFPEEKRYETDEHFRSRIRGDLRKSIELLEAKVGVRPYIITWSYGEFNTLGMEEAKDLGFEMMLTLVPGSANVNKLEMINRNIITKAIDLERFTSRMKNRFSHFKKHKMRIAQLDLDMIVNPDSYEESDYNLGLLIERLIALGVNTVFLQGYCDRYGSGNIRSLYFNSRTLPVEFDFLSHVANRIRIRGIEVYIWMPVLSYELPDATLNESLMVRECKDEEISITTSWYRRLSPFDERSLKIVRSIYRDLSAHVRFSGILFQDDAYLTDEEDFHPAAFKEFKEQYGIDVSPHMLKDDQIKRQWIEMKTTKVSWFTQELKEVIKKYRPMAKIARNIYSEVVLNPSAQEWFSQDFETFLHNYDYTVIMAYPQMEGVGGMRATRAWFTKLVDRVSMYNSINRVIFKIQSYDWSQKFWIDDDVLVKELKCLLSLGVKHVGYYPDNVFEDRPRIEEVVSTISAREYPRKWQDESLVETD